MYCLGVKSKQNKIFISENEKQLSDTSSTYTTKKRVLLFSVLCSDNLQYIACENNLQNIRTSKQYLCT